MMRKTFLYSSTLILIAFLVSLPAFQTGTLWWDEAVYLGLAENVQDHGAYRLDVTAKVVDDFRPPFFPLLIVVTQTFFGQTELVARLINPFITMLTVLSLFYVGKKMYNEEIGFIAAVLVVTNSQYVFWNSKILSEPLAILVATWTLFCAYMAIGKGEKMYYAALFPLLVLAFLTRYPLGALAIAVSLYALFVRKKELINDIRSTPFCIGLVLSFLLLLPWLIYNQHTYGNILGAMLANLSVVQQYENSAWIYAIQFLPNLQILGITAIVAVIFSFNTRDKKDLVSSIFILVCFTAFAFLLGQKDFRYTVVTLPAMALISASLIERMAHMLDMPKVFAFLSVALIISVSLPLGFERAQESKKIGNSPQLAAQYLSERLPEDTTIMTKHYPLFAYLTKRHTVDFPYSPREIDAYIEKHNVSYVVIDTIEDYPLWAIEHMQHHSSFRVEKIINDSLHQATIYRQVA